MYRFWPGLGLMAGCGSSYMSIGWYGGLGTLTTHPNYVQNGARGAKWHRFRALCRALSLYISLPLSTSLSFSLEHDAHAAAITPPSQLTSSLCFAFGRYVL